MIGGGCDRLPTEDVSLGGRLRARSDGHLVGMEDKFGRRDCTYSE